MSQLSTRKTSQTPAFLDDAIDLDSHEMAPTYLWGEMFGEHSARFASRMSGLLASLGEISLVRPGLEDTAEITPEAVWSTKGPTAPGAFDFERRIQVLDVMGTRRQLVFPTSQIGSFAMVSGVRNPDLIDLDLSPETEAMLRGAIREYNDWTLRTIAKHPDRYRPVAMLAAARVHDLLAQASALVKGGARAVWLPSAAPPAGRSPADPDLDPFWSMMEEADVAVTLHLGTEWNYRVTEAWSGAPAFEPGKVESTEITMNPFDGSMLYAVPSTYLTAMVLGGVFERHPRLRFGVIELGADWFGPLAEHLDLWAAKVFRRRISAILKMPPSAYLARNVRVTPYHFEPVARYFERYPQLRDCYCYATDYPHPEGGAHSKARFYEELASLGEEVVKRFFVSNGEWLVPE